MFLHANLSSTAATSGLLPEDTPLLPPLLTLARGRLYYCGHISLALHFKLLIGTCFCFAQGRE